MRKVLITGANSYIGTSVERYIMGNCPNDFEIETIDMMNESWREKSFKGYDTVFHVAGIAHSDSGKISAEKEKLYRSVNTDLTIEVAQKDSLEMDYAAVAARDTVLRHTRGNYKPLPMHTAYKQLGFDIRNYPNAYAQFANEITLPLHTSLTNEEVAYIIQTYSTLASSYQKSSLSADAQLPTTTTPTQAR